jgi:hypothetical protein
MKDTDQMARLLLIRDQYIKGLAFVQGNSILQKTTQDKIDQLTIEIQSLKSE